VECDFDLFVRNLKIVLAKENGGVANSDNDRKFSIDNDSEAEDASSNH
jgi:hypothetical protein